MRYLSVRWSLLGILMLVQSMVLTAQPALLIPTSQDTTHRDVLQRPDSVKGFKKLIYKTFAASSGRMEQRMAAWDQAYYARFQGRTVREVHISANNIFQSDNNGWGERLANSLHVVSKEKTIRKDVFFRSGDQFDTLLVAANRHLLRSRTYISEVRVLVVPVEYDTTMVDLFYITRDQWSLTARVGTQNQNESFFEVYENNLFGWGHSLGIATSINWRDSFKYGGNQFMYHIPNIGGTFFSGDLIAGKRYEDFQYSVGVNKEFFLRKDYAGGAFVGKRRQSIDLFPQDTIIRSADWSMDLWGGYSWEMSALNHSNYYFTGRTMHQNYTERPGVNSTYNPYFYDQTLLLLNTGVYREGFRIASLIYGYGVTEFIPYGYRMGILGGYSWEEYGNMYYLGADVSAGAFTSIGYFGGQLGLGSYIDAGANGGGFQRSTAKLKMNYFSHLLGNGPYNVRQFITLNVTQGWNRLSGFREEIGFLNDARLRGIRTNAFGRNRLVLNSETVFFTPWHLHEFRFAMFLYGDVGLIGNDPGFFTNEFYGTVGIGARIKNEHLVFRTINIRLGIAVNKNGLMDNAQYFNIASENRMRPLRYIPTKPQIVEYW